MRRSILALSLLVFGLAVSADLSAQTAPVTPAKPDALLLYRQGRDLETAGKTADAQAKYAESVTVCDQEIAADPRRIDAYVVKCWSLFRLGKYQDVVNAGNTALKIQYDARISEIMGEAYFFLGQNDLALRSFQKYFETASEDADRLPTAYFYVGETYFRMKKYSHADIAYSTAVHREPNMARWWYRLGLACENLGEWSRANDAYGKALSLSPSMADALSGRDRVKGKLSSAAPAAAPAASAAPAAAAPATTTP
jgi:tetratricopeptide (TPR) repeat protein